MARDDLLTSAQAITLFEQAGLSEATFYRKVRDEKLIDKILPRGRSRGALYPKKQVNKVIQDETGKTPLEERDEPLAETDWIQTRDLPYVLALDLDLYGVDNVPDISITHSWWEKNPYMCRILFDKKDRRNVWGALTIMPLKEDIIIKVLNNEVEEDEIRPDDIFTYEKGKEYVGYVASTVIRPEYQIYLRKLIKDMLSFLCDQYPDIKISKLYAFAGSPEGWELISHFFFAPRYDIGENAFELDLSRRNPNRLISDFQNCIKSKDEVG